MSRRIRILIVDDHALLREGLRALLTSEPRFEVVGDVADCQEAKRAVAATQPDVVLMDLSLPGISGMDAIREIKSRYPEVRVIALTIHKTDEYVRSALQAGAEGYLLKDSTHAELKLAIQSVLAGKAYLSPEVTHRIVSGYRDGDRQRVASERRSWDHLSDRERQILKLVAEGRKNKEIASYLSISPKTVEKHRANLMRKLDLHSASALTAFAIENGLVSR
jgi:DNA-binding NarL/FixJ family response regulator